MRLESGADLIFQARWKMGKRPESLNRRALDYLGGLEKGARRRRLPFTCEVNPTNAATDFHWHSEHKGYGRALFDSLSSRTFLIELSGPKQKSFKREARDMISGFQVPDRDTLRWELLDLRVELPKLFVLGGVGLLSGKVTLNFRRRGWQLVVERWGFAEQLIQKHGLAAWAKSATGLPPVEESENRVTLAKAARLHRKPQTAYVDFQREANKLIILRATHPRADTPKWDWIL